MKRIGPSEAQLHVSVAEFLDWILLPPAMYSTFPAGWGKLGLKTSKQLKRSGLKPGMPDVLVFPGHGGVVGIELKADGNYLTPIQRETHKMLRDAGVHVYVAKCIEDVIEVLTTELIPMRPTGGRQWRQGHKELPPDATSAKRAGGAEGRGGVDGTQTTKDGIGSSVA